MMFGSFYIYIEYKYILYIIYNMIEITNHKIKYLKYKIKYFKMINEKQLEGGVKNCNNCGCPGCNIVTCPIGIEEDLDKWIGNNKGRRTHVIYVIKEYIPTNDDDLEWMFNFLFASKIYKDITKKLKDPPIQAPKAPLSVSLLDELVASHNSTTSVELMPAQLENTSAPALQPVVQVINEFDECVLDTTESTMSYNQSQNAGFKFENIIKELVFQLEPETNNTDIHDVDHSRNRFNNNENISIKSTGSTTICCSDIIRFSNYDFSKINTIIVIKYNQQGDFKIIEESYEINYTKELHIKLFGNLPRKIIDEYITKVKNIPHGKQPEDKWWIKEAKKMKTEHKMNITINPKIDSKTQRRVQCSIPNFIDLCDGYIKKNEIPNVIRGVKIPMGIPSSKRTFNK